MLKFDALKYPPPPSEITAYQVTDPTICRSECRISMNRVEINLVSTSSY